MITVAAGGCKPMLGGGTYCQCVSKVFHFAVSRAMAA